MFKKLKRKIGLIVALILMIQIFSPSMELLASNNNSIYSLPKNEELKRLIFNKDYIDRQEIRINKMLKIKPESNIELTNLFQYLKQSEFLFVDNFGHIAVRVKAEEINVPQDLFDRFLEDMDCLNDSVDKGLIFLDRKELKVKSATVYVEMGKDSILEYSESKLNGDLKEYDDIRRLEIEGYRNLPEFDLVREVKSNYRRLVNYYNSQVRLKNNYPDLEINPYMQTVIYWIYEVKPQGNWDYKTREGFKPYNKQFVCTQFNGNRVIRTSEYIGNYNYGYTGHFLFSLDVLKVGSFVVAVGGNESTFDLSNEFSDQRVIHFAYRDAEAFER